MTLTNIRALEFYSGIGGLHVALQRSTVDGEVVRAFDWDQAACQVYDHFHGLKIVQRVDITTLTAGDMAVHGANLWLMSPSCQPYTVLNPLAKGADDPRAKSFIHLIDDVLPELVSAGMHPTHILVENVAGFETSSTRQNVLKTLDRLGYTTMELLLTPLQYGVPNSRLRYYLLAKAKSSPFAYSDAPSSRVWRHIPGQGEDWIDPRLDTELDAVTSISRLQDFLDDDAAAATTIVATIPDRVLEKWGRLFDIVLPSQRRSCCFTRGYTRLVERAGSILQMNEELDTTVLFNIFLEAQSREDSKALEILAPLRLRYFTPSELLRIFGFNASRSDGLIEDEFLWPPGLTAKTQYKLIGNSVNVGVVTKLIDYLFK
ncbi:hypothetical protein EIP91_007942 [Steccherinum ochraceum]|uniref:tRNA (cytosine(38)-C(5))-methyltransferase n=1 Tax=Steccherinum ochraceum TaxID=92696 RepID=A0A4R0RDS4_9APHY|nr:hypothetical protein EIP91_007942 [Steccherinum ochraceum]